MELWGDADLAESFQMVSLMGLDFEIRGHSFDDPGPDCKKCCHEQYT